MRRTEIVFKFFEKKSTRFSGFSVKENRFPSFEGDLFINHFWSCGTDECFRNNCEKD